MEEQAGSAMAGATMEIPERIDREVAERIDWGEVPEFRKVALTRAIRLAPDREFTVETSEGELTVRDGWLCLDARGYPYPVADEEFRLIYAPAVEGQQGPGGSFIELAGDLLARANARRSEWSAGDGGAAREMALAATALEDAMMRWTRGLAKKLGVFNPVDLERVQAEGERARFEGEAKAAGGNGG